MERIKAVADIKQDYSYSDEYQLMYEKLKTCGFKIDITKPEIIIRDDFGKFNKYFNL